MDSFIVNNNLFGEHPTFLKAIDVLKFTKNPGIIAHAAWLYSYLFDFIRNSYLETK
jgi:hypothetical protein